MLHLFVMVMFYVFPCLISIQMFHKAQILKAGSAWIIWHYNISNLCENIYLKNKRISIYVSETIYTVMMQSNVSKNCKVLGIISNKKIIRRSKSLHLKKNVTQMFCILVFWTVILRRWVNRSQFLQDSVAQSNILQNYSFVFRKSLNREEGSVIFSFKYHVDFFTLRLTSYSFSIKWWELN